MDRPTSFDGFNPAPKNDGPFRCGGIITWEESRDDLRERGFTEDAIDELMQMKAYLLAKEDGRFNGTWDDWSERADHDPQEEEDDAN